MRIAYIAHPVGAVNPKNKRDAEEQVIANLDEIAQISRLINLTEPDTVPFAPYYLDCVTMDDSNPEERQRGIDNDTALIKAGFIDEIRLYGNRISFGMLCEIQLAKSLGISVVPMTPETTEQFANL